MKVLRIARHLVGRGRRCFVIAEAGVNHNGRVELARRMVDAAAAAGADAVKFQTFAADRLAAPRARKASYQAKATGREGSQHAMLKALELSAPAHRELQARCRRLGLVFLSTPFDEESADFLEAIGVPAYKLSSGDLTNHPLIAHVAAKGRPLILSTGMATLAEVAAAVAVARRGRGGLALLQCTSNYPSDPAHANLRVMRTYETRFGVPAGYSDHTPGIAAAIAAVALGAAIIEKHFTLERRLAGPDHASSLEPRELAAMIAGIRVAERALGDGVKAPLAAERPMRAAARKSLHWRRDIAPGARVAARDLVALRPGDGLPPAAIDGLVGRTAVRAARAGARVELADFGGGKRR
ncbi:MAG: N-acetylneuraminate synthase [Burkholderiales bacterium]|nr:N-acetylneuraminate synthase [Burkholderiales bacterium]